MGSKVEDIRWSRRAYSLREALKRCTFPQIMKVSGGFVSSDENETMSKDQIIRIHQIHTQTRVLASTKKNKYLSVPLRYADARFEIVTPKKHSKPMYMRDVIDRSLLPQEVGFFLGDDLVFDLQTKKGSISEKLSPLIVRNMYEVCYLQGNAIYHNHLDTQVINIPLHLPIQVNLAEGFTKHSVEQWGRYQTLLEKLVSKHVTFELFPGNQNITFFADKSLERAETQEDYERIWPTGTLYITSAKDRIRSKPAAGAASRTVGHNPSPRAVGRVGATMGSRQSPVTKKVEAGRGRSVPPLGAATVPRNVRSAGQGVTKGSPTTNHGDRIQKTAATEAAKPPALPTSARPTNDSPRSAEVNHSSGNDQVDTDIRRRQHRPPPITTSTKLGSLNRRNRSPSLGSITVERRNRSPSVGSQQSHDHVLLSPTGRIKKGPATDHTPSAQSAFDGRSISTTSSSDSDYTHLKTLPVDIPAPDYDSGDSVFSFTAAGRPPPTPPPISSIPLRQDKVVVSNSFAVQPTILSTPAVPQQPTSTVPVASSQSQQAPPTAPVAPAPPPAPPFPAVYVPPPPPPPPPLPAVLGVKPSPNAILKPVGISTLQPKPVLSSEPTMDSMMEELKKAQKQRRLSRGTDLDVVPTPNSTATDGGRVTFHNGNVKSITQMNNHAAYTKNPPVQSSAGKELQSILSGRKASIDVSAALKGGNPLPVAPRPGRFGANRAPKSTPSQNDTFSRVEDIPSQLKGLTVAQVAQCLRLLNLDRYIDVFRKNCIDGEMMMSLSKDMLGGDLKLTGFDIEKVMKFINGWRPK